MKQICICLFCVAVFLSGCNNHKPSINNNLSLAELHNQASKYYNEDLDSMFIVADRMLMLLNGDTLSPYWGHALIHKATVHELQGRYDSAAYYYYDALRKAEKINDTPLLSRALNNLGILYFSLRQTEEAVKCYQRFLELSREAGDSVMVTKALNNIGNAYATIDQDFDKAIPYFEACINVAEAIGNEEAYSTAKLTLIQIQVERFEFDEALLSIKEIRARGVDHYYVDYAEAGIYKGTKEFDKAIVLYNKILKMKLNSREFVLAILTELIQIYQEKGDFQMALNYKDQYQADRDSLHKIEIGKAIETLKITYDTEKKEMAIASLKKEKYLFLWIGIAGVVLLLFVLLLLLSRHRIISQKKELAEQRISELEKEKQLIATQAVLDGETAERVRLARDLHDGLGSMLTGVKMKLESVKHGAVLNSAGVEYLDNAFGMLNESMIELRRVAHHLMPDSLSRYGLKTALTDFCKSFPSIQFDYFGSEERLDSKMEVMVYRIIHELVNNALKHSGATQIMVQVICDKEYIGIIVRDNGCGFDLSSEAKGMGLQNIRDRVDSNNGRMEIVSKTDEGSEINVEFKSLHPRSLL